MKLKVKFIGFPGRKSPSVDVVELESGARVEDLLRKFNILGGSPPYVVLIDGRTLTLDQLLPEDAEVTIFPPLVGG